MSRRYRPHARPARSYELRIVRDASLMLVAILALVVLAATGLQPT